MYPNNKLIVDQFYKLINYSKAKKENTFKISSYFKVGTIVTNLKYEINLDNLDKVRKITGIGDSTIEKFTAILKNGSLDELKDSNPELEKMDAINKLAEIHGIGTVKANELYKNGITINNIKNHTDQLSEQQLIGLKYNESIHKRIPRKEIDKYKKKLTILFTKFDPKLLFEICGSYRRGLPDSGDIDVLITKTDFKLLDIVQYLKKSKLLIDDLTTKGNSKYMGISKVSSKAISRRIDIRLIPYESYYYATLYFTGNKELNKQMRDIAKQKNWKLNEYGLYDADNNLLSVSSEEDIFKLLKIPYLEPSKREI